jgi:hypothetical protein
MWSSRKSSVKRHIQNAHRGNSNLVSFIDYLIGRRSGFYFPAPRPTYEKKSGTATTTVTVMDTVKGEVWKAIATKAANKVLNPSSSVAVNQQQYLSNFQGYDSYNYPSQLYSEPLHIIPKPEDIFGFEIYVCKKCASIEPIVVSFSDDKEGGSKMSWAPANPATGIVYITENSPDCISGHVRLVSYPTQPMTILTFYLG